MYQMRPRAYPVSIWETWSASSQPAGSSRHRSKHGRIVGTWEVDEYIWPKHETRGWVNLEKQGTAHCVLTMIILEGQTPLPVFLMVQVVGLFKWLVFAPSIFPPCHQPAPNRQHRCNPLAKNFEKDCVEEDSVSRLFFRFHKLKFRPLEVYLQAACLKISKLLQPSKSNNDVKDERKLIYGIIWSWIRKAKSNIISTTEDGGLMTRMAG